MKLNYRGNSYDYTPPQVASAQGKIGGKYRGLDWRFRNLAKPMVIQPPANLVYRGVAFRTAAAPSASTEPASAPAMSIGDKARALMMKHHRAIGKRQQTLLTRSADQVGLHVTSYWNRIQGKVHPSFRASYDRSQASFS